MTDGRSAGARIAEYAAVAVLIAGTAWLGKVMHHNYVVHDSSRTVEGVPTAPVDLPVTTVDGAAETLQVAGRSRPLVLLVLKTTCPFCEQNMPEWRRLAERLEAMGEDGPEIYVLSVSEGVETGAYLGQHELDVPFRMVDTSLLQLIGVSGYPTTVAIDPATRQANAWTGVLGAGAHAAIDAWARSVTAGAAPAARVPVPSAAGGPAGP